MTPTTAPDPGGRAGGLFPGDRRPAPCRRHFDDSPVFRSPLQDLRDAAARAGLSGRIHVLTRGELYTWELAPPAWLETTVHPA